MQRSTVMREPGVGLLAAGIVALVVVGTGLSFALLPRSLELQEMLLTESRFDEALMLVDRDATDRLSQAYHARLLYEAGDVDGAIAVFERLDTARGTLARDPSAAGSDGNGHDASGLDDDGLDAEGLDAEGLETLAWYYGQAGRLRDKHLVLLRLSGNHLNDADSRELLEYFIATSMHAEAVAVLEHRVAAGFATVPEISRLAMAYRYAGRSDDALALYLGLSPEALGEADAVDLRNFMRLMTRAGRGDELAGKLAAWIPATLSPDDMYARLSILIEQDQPDLALAIASERRIDDARFAEVYDAALYRLRDGSEVYARLYHQRLYERLLANAAELRALAVAGPETGRYEVLRRDARSLLSAYFDYADADAEAGYEALVAEDYPAPELLKEAFYARLSQQGQSQRLAEYLAADSTDPSLDSAARLEIAGRLVFLGEYDAAVPLYRALVDSDGPSSPAMQGLLYAWNRAGKPVDIDWLGKRLLAASAADYPLWENAFLGAGKAGRLANWLSRASGRAAHPELVLGTRITLASWQKGVPGLAPLLQQAADNTRLAPALSRRYFALACDNGIDAAASRLWQTLSDSARVDGPAEACAGRLANADRRHADAVARYEAAVAAGTVLGAADLVRYAASVEQVAGPRVALKHYRAALDALPPPARSSVAELQTRGHVNQLIGDDRAAIAAYRDVLARAVDERDRLTARRELMRLYVDTGDYEQALALDCEAGDCGL